MEEKNRRLTKTQMMILAAAGVALCAGVVTLLLLRPWAVSLTQAYAMTIEGGEEPIAMGEEVSLHTDFTILDEKKAARTEDELSETVFIWSSSDETVATVSADGTVRAVGPGTATITVTGGELSAQCDVRVYVPLKAILLSGTEITVGVGEEILLSWQPDPADAELMADAVWTSKDPAVAAVDGNGKVTAVEPGTTIITVAIGDIEASCAVTVVAPITEISISESNLDLIDGESASLSVTIQPENTTDDTRAVWTTSDEAVAVVDENGTVTAVDPGTAVITAAVGTFRATCQVNITAPLTDFHFHFETLTLRNGDSATLPVSYEPLNTTDALNITWKSSNDNIVKVDANGKVTAVNPGTAVVRATCGGFVDECTISVIIPVNSVYISQTSLTLNKGEGLTLTAGVGPANTTEDRTISWTSDNTAVATVKNGVVTAVGPGTARIIASHNDYTAVCTVTVYSPMTGIGMEPETLSVIEGYDGRLHVNFLPADTTDPKDVVWTSSDETIATVKDGLVHGLAVGTCEITATCGAFSATRTVTVHPFVEVESITLDVTDYDFEEIGKSLQLTATVAPDNATFGSVSFATSDSSVATVNAQGLVTAVGEGEAVITATAGGKTVQCTVRVPKPDVIIVLDPGHGGQYPGACYYGYTEKYLNLRVAWYCRDYLEANYTGIKVYLTHEDDTHLNNELSADLEARAQFAQDVGASILVSLHFNASSGHNTGGCMAMVSKQSNVGAQSTALANSILTQLAKLGLRNRGPWSGSSDTYFDPWGNPLDDYAINRHCANRGIPGIIVEHCFMDYESDLKYFNSDEALKKLGVADAIGIANYLGLEKK